MDSHFHLNVRLRPDLQQALSDEDVLERWWKLFPPKSMFEKLVGVLNWVWVGVLNWVYNKNIEAGSRK